MKTRISKKSLAAFPAPVAESIKELGEHYGISSFNFKTEMVGFSYWAGEGERITAIVNDRKASVEMVSNNTIGAAGLHHNIGDKIELPVGSFLVVIGYYTRYYMTVYNICHRQVENGAAQ